MLYTPGRIWAIMVDPSDADLDEQIDVSAGLSLLSLPKRTFILLIAHGYTVSFAKQVAGIRHGDAGRMKRNVLVELTDLINEGEGL
jgi:hypothetical protein